jgi:hypothetical protein
MIQQKMQAEQIIALKTGQKEKLGLLRMLLARIKNAQIEKKAELTDEEIIIILQKFAKELKEAISAFEKGKRFDLAAENKRQLAIIHSYLPPQASDEELIAEIKKIIAANQPLAQQNSKALIGLCIKQLKSKAEPQRIIKLLSLILKKA